MPFSVQRTALSDVASTEQFAAYVPWTESASPCVCVGGAIDSVNPTRGEIARCAVAPSISRITPTFSAEFLEVGDCTFGGGVRPHIELRRLEAVQRQDRADLRPVVASVVRELSERHPELHIHLAPLVVDLLIEVDVLQLEKLLDRVADARQTRRDLIDGRGELH